MDTEVFPDSTDISSISGVAVHLKACRNSLLQSTAFEALLSIIRYTFTVARSCTDPISKSFEWDRGTFMCSRVFDDVMDEQYDKMLAELPPQEKAQYNNTIKKELRKRRNSGAWEKKTKLPIAQFEKDPEDSLMRFKVFRAQMQEIMCKDNEG